MMKFGLLLSKFRKKAILSQKELARIVGLDPTYLSKIEHNQRKPPDRSVVIEIANTLELRENEIDQLLVSAGYQPQTLFDLGFDQNDFSLKRHINVLNSIKNIPEVCSVYCATANPTAVVIAKSTNGNGILGVIDGSSPKGVENDEEKRS